MIQGLSLVFNGASPPYAPVVVRDVTIALEKAAGSAFDPASAPEGGGVCLTASVAGGRLVACHRQPSQKIHYDTVLKLQFWSSEKGWFVLLPTEQVAEMFQGVQDHLYCLAFCRPGGWSTGCLSALAQGAQAGGVLAG
jgi:hypothetical protein